LTKYEATMVISVMQHIKLSKGTFAIVDDEEFERLNKYGWWLGAGGYPLRQIYIGKSGDKYLYKNVFMHQDIMGTKIGFRVDHVDGNKLDNQKKNLRFASKSQNNWNRKNTNPSGYKGIQFHTTSKKWRAKITKNDKQYFLGCFDTKEEAAKAYDNAANQLFGDFARLNFKR